MMLRLAERALGAGGILAYHGVRESGLLPSVHVTPAAFRAHMEFLTGAYTVIALHEFVSRRREGRSVRGCAAVTFDDAYTGVRDHALPVLEQLGIPATVFACSSFSAAGSRFWWDRFEWVAARVPGAEKEALVRSVGLGAGAADHEVRDRIITAFQGMIPPALDHALAGAEAGLGQVPERAMSADELLALSKSPLVDFGAHTARHPALPWLAPADAEREIRTSYEWLRERLPVVRPYLAYPFGLYTRETIAAARRASMEAAFSMEARATTSWFPQYYCPRIGIADVNTIRGMRLRLAWASIPIVALRNRGFHPRLRPAESA